MFTFKHFTLTALVAVTALASSIQLDAIKHRTRARTELTAPTPDFMAQLPATMLELVAGHTVMSTPHTSVRDVLSTLTTLRCVNRTLAGCLASCNITRAYAPALHLLATAPDADYRLTIDDNAVAFTAALGHVDLLRLIAPSHLHFYNNRSAAHYAAYHNQPETLAALVIRNHQYHDTMDGDNKTPLHIAVQRKHLGCVQVLLNHQRDIAEYEQVRGATTQKTAQKIEHLKKLQTAANAGDFDLLRDMLMSLEIPENANDANGDTALVRATKAHDLPEAQRLLAIPGINVNASNIYGQTALILAAMSDNLPMVQALLAMPGIDVNARNIDGRTAWDVAARHGHHKIAALIRAHMAQHPEPDQK